MKKILLYSLLLISIGLSVAVCGNQPETINTSIPLAAITPEGAASLVPTLSHAELFYQMSQKWKVAFVDTESRKVCIMNADGSNKSCLEYQDYDYPDGYRRKLGCWSPDGSKFAYDRNDDTGIFIWEPGGRVTAFYESGEGLIYRQPFWSVDGKYIAYQVEQVAGWNIPADIPGTYIESLDHSYKIRISAEKVTVDWSPDNKYLLFSDGNIFTALADGTNPRKLTQDGGGYGYPTWSPDGLQIAFIRRHGSHNELYIMNADGSDIHKIFDLEIRNPYSMLNYSWLAQERFILYDNELIEVETGISTELRFPFDPTSAVWYTRSNGHEAVSASRFD